MLNKFLVSCLCLTLSPLSVIGMEKQDATQVCSMSDLDIYKPHIISIKEFEAIPRVLDKNINGHEWPNPKTVEDMQEVEETLKVKMQHGDAHAGFMIFLNRYNFLKNLEAEGQEGKAQAFATSQEALELLTWAANRGNSYANVELQVIMEKLGRPDIAKLYEQQCQLFNKYRNDMKALPEKCEREALNIISEFFSAEFRKAQETQYSELLKRYNVSQKAKELAEVEVAQNHQGLYFNFLQEAELMHRDNVLNHYYSYLVDIDKNSRLKGCSHTYLDLYKPRLMSKEYSKVLPKVLGKKRNPNFADMGLPGLKTAEDMRNAEIKSVEMMKQDVPYAGYLVYFTRCMLLRSQGEGQEEKVAAFATSEEALKLLSWSANRGDRNANQELQAIMAKLGRPDIAKLYEQQNQVIEKYRDDMAALPEKIKRDSLSILSEKFPDEFKKSFNVKYREVLNHYNVSDKAKELAEIEVALNHQDTYSLCLRELESNSRENTINKYYSMPLDGEQ